MFMTERMEYFFWLHLITHGVSSLCILGDKTGKLKSTIFWEKTACPIADILEENTASQG
jgi:hypothetical protein